MLEQEKDAPNKNSENVQVLQSGSIRRDPFIRAFLEKMPSDVEKTFTDAQLLQVKLMYGTRAKASHMVDIRTVVGAWNWQYYLVFLFGRNRRDLTRAEQTISDISRVLILLLGTFVLFCVVTVSLYLLKSFAGIDILPNFSFGLWHQLSA
ncbi:hypothetical protein BCS58_02875 [Enterovibrio norvegicus]|uniref:hypothetical protein n=1 Tax=Enterovibrio norvegicus TaxID=188144 RepID=UPI00389A9EA8